MDSAFYLSRLLSFDPSSTRIWKFPKYDGKLTILQMTNSLMNLFANSTEQNLQVVVTDEQEQELKDVFSVCKALGLVYQVEARAYRPSKTLIAGLEERLDFLQMWQIALLNFQFPCSSDMPEFRNLDRRLQVKPFLFLLQLLHDPELNYSLNKKEVRLALVYGNNPSCLEVCKERILDYRRKGKWTIVRNYKQEWYDLDTQVSPDDLLTRITTQAEYFTNLAINSKLVIPIWSGIITYSKMVEPLFMSAQQTNSAAIGLDGEVNKTHETEDFLYEKVSQFIRFNEVPDVDEEAEASQGGVENGKEETGKSSRGYLEAKLTEYRKKVPIENLDLPCVVLEMFGYSGTKLKLLDMTYRSTINDVWFRLFDDNNANLLDFVVKSLQNEARIILYEFINQDDYEKYLNGSRKWSLSEAQKADIENKLIAIALYCKRITLRKKGFPKFDAWSLMLDYSLNKDIAKGLVSLLDNEEAQSEVKRARSSKRLPTLPPVSDKKGKANKSQGKKNSSKTNIFPVGEEQSSTKKRAPRKLDLHQIVKEIVALEFQQGIRTKHESEIIDLRTKIARKYPQSTLPTNNRQIISICKKSLLDWGDGVYIAPKSAHYPQKLLDEILNYIRDDSRSEKYYSDIFNRFQGRLNFETNITSPIALRSLLQSLFEEEFTFNEKFVSRNISDTNNIDKDVYQIITMNGGNPIQRNELCEELFGGNDSILKSEIKKSTKVIKWGDTTYFHTDLLKNTAQINKAFSALLRKQIERNNGFTSMSLFYAECVLSNSAVMEENHISNEIELYNYCQFFLGNLFNFQQPNIFLKESPNKTIPELIRDKFLDTEFTDKEVITYGEVFSWSQMSITNGIILMANSSHIRISNSRFMPRVDFSQYEKWCDDVNRILDIEIDGDDYCLSSSLEPFLGFPHFGLPWNAYLLESFLSLPKARFRVLPVDKENRLQYFFIVVRKNSKYFSYNELVADLLRKSAFAVLSEAEMEDFLLDNGLGEGGVPTIIKKDPKFHFSDGRFSLL